MTVKYIKKIDEKTKIDLIIPAAGAGKRMKSYGPKSLIKLENNLTIIENILKVSSFLPVERTILISGFQSKILMNNTDDKLIKIENEFYEETNVARSIGMGLRATVNDVLIIYGDLVFNKACLEHMNFNKSSVIVGNHIMSSTEIGCTINNKYQVEHFMYDLEKKWGQMIFLKGRELDLFKEICWNEDNYNMYGFEVMNKIIDQGGKFYVREEKDMKVIDIDSSKDLERVSEIL